MRISCGLCHMGLYQIHVMINISNPDYPSLGTLPSDSSSRDPSRCRYAQRVQTEDRASERASWGHSGHLLSSSHWVHRCTSRGILLYHSRQSSTLALSCWTNMHTCLEAHSRGTKGLARPLHLSFIFLPPSHQLHPTLSSVFFRPLTSH
jgi:hypothetical protein